jgi:hypothetical protein
MADVTGYTRDHVLGHSIGEIQVLAERRKACHGDTKAALQAGASPLCDSNTSSAPAVVAAAR